MSIGWRAWIDLRPSPAAPATFPGRLVRTRLYEQVAEQITAWIADNGLQPGDRLPPERELAARLGVSRATLSQALVALEVIGVVAVRHGDGTVVTQSRTRRIVEAIRAARRPAAGDHRHPRRPRDQDRRAGRGPAYRRGPARASTTPWRPWRPTSRPAAAGSRATSGSTAP